MTTAILARRIDDRLEQRLQTERVEPLHGSSLNFRQLIDLLIHYCRFDPDPSSTLYSDGNVPPADYYFRVYFRDSKKKHDAGSRLAVRLADYFIIIEKIASDDVFVLRHVLAATITRIKRALASAVDSDDLGEIVDACDTFTISGRVADQGSGLDTWIGVFQDPLANRAKPVESTWVDAGEFELEVPRAESVTLLAVRKGAVPLARRISGSAPTAVDLRLAPGLSLTGSVHSDKNLPIDEARVSITRIDEAEVRLPESLTTWRSSKDGAFVAGGLAPGTYRVAASADGHMPVELPEVVVGEGGANRVDMRLPKAFFIAGRVVDTSGLAVAGAEIHGESSTSRGTTAGTTPASDSEGAFRIGPFRKGQRVRVSARANLLRSDAAYFLAPMDDLVLTLHDAVEIRGSVSNAFTGELLNDFALKAYGPEVRSFAFRDAAGEFSAAIFCHTHTIAISAPGIVSWYTPVDFGSGGGEHDFGDVALEPERIATGRVLDAASGLPVQGASVRRWFDRPDFRNRLEFDPASRVALAATTDEDGRFRLSGLPRDDVLLQAQPIGVLARGLAAW